MTLYINWMAMTQPIKGDLAQMEGNAVADAVTVASGGTSAAAPEGAQYASVWCDVPTTVEADIISMSPTGEPNGRYSAREIKIPAGITFQIPNIVAGKTTIKATDIT